MIVLYHKNYKLTLLTATRRLEVFKIGGGIKLPPPPRILNVFQEKRLILTQHKHLYKLHVWKFLK